MFTVASPPQEPDWAEQQQLGAVEEGDEEGEDDEELSA
jgi:hypothetical protein